MIIAFDTSCYTTSLAIIGQDGTIHQDRRILLSVKPGERGLRQSDALFQHLQNLPRLLDQPLPKADFQAVAASVRPRPVDNSYLPVFTAGSSCGETLAGLLGVPFIGTSHQEGHIRAGMFENDLSGPSLAWHISGGTTELLMVTPGLLGYKIELIGGSSDLHVGQFVDRVGIALGTGFPAGPVLEKMALTAENVVKLPVVAKDLTLSFSGPDSAARRLIETGNTLGAELARGVFQCIALSLLKVTVTAVTRYQLNKVLLVGGVASNSIVRDILQQEGERNGIRFYFGRKELSSDNAVGVGLIARDYLAKGSPQ